MKSLKKLTKDNTAVIITNDAETAFKATVELVKKHFKSDIPISCDTEEFDKAYGIAVNKGRFNLIPNKEFLEDLKGCAQYVIDSTKEAQSSKDKTPDTAEEAPNTNLEGENREMFDLILLGMILFVKGKLTKDNFEFSFKDGKVSFKAW